MTKRQYQHARRLLKQDCQLKGQYMDDEGNTCAIGCLGLAAGVKPRTLRKYGGQPISWLAGLSRAIKRKFGLDWEQQLDIQRNNDCTFYVRRRRSLVVRCLDQLFKDQ